MANREWLKNYLGAVLELDSPILEAINENAFKPVHLNCRDFYNHTLFLARNNGWVLFFTEHGTSYLQKKSSFIAFDYFSSGEFCAHFGCPSFKIDWYFIGTDYTVDGEKVSYDVWIKSLEGAILQ